MHDDRAELPPCQQCGASRWRLEWHDNMSDALATCLACNNTRTDDVLASLVGAD